MNAARRAGHSRLGGERQGAAVERAFAGPRPRACGAAADTCDSTVRSEMYSRAAISAFVRCSPMSASTSAFSRPPSRPGQPSHPPAPPSRRQHVTGEAVESVPGTDADVVDGAHAPRHEEQPPPPPCSRHGRRRDGDDRRPVAQWRRPCEARRVPRARHDPGRGRQRGVPRRSRRRRADLLVHGRGERPTLEPSAGHWPTSTARTASSS